MQDPIEHRQQDVFLGAEVIHQLAAAHLDLALDLRQRQVLDALFGNDGQGSIDDLFAPNTGDIATRRFHGSLAFAEFYSRSESGEWIEQSSFRLIGLTCQEESVATRLIFPTQNR